MISYFIAVAIGVGFCLFNGIRHLFSSIPGLDEEQASIISIMAAFFGSIAVLTQTEKIARQLADKENSN